MTVAVLVDSASDLSIAQANEMGVHLLLQMVHFAGQNWLDHTDLTPEDMFRQVKNGADYPTTQPVSVELYHRTLENLLQKHSHVFAIHPSPSLSQMIKVAQAAAQNFPGRVTIHDSNKITGPMALQAERAVRLLRQGIAPQETSEVLLAVEQQTEALLCLSTTEFFRRSGSVSDAVALAGGFLNVRPILTMKNGRLIAVARPLSQRAALSAMRQQLRQIGARVQEPRIVFFHNGSSDTVDELRGEAQQLGVTEVLTLQLGVLISAHCGPQAYGFAVEPTHIWQNFRSY